jgi:small subunit ribosomal protein S5
VTAAGIQNVSSKIMGTKNKMNNVYATLEALKMLQSRKDHTASRKEGLK